MRRVRFRDLGGSERIGEWTDDGIEFGNRLYDVATVEVLPPTRPSKIICAAGNYVEHLREGGKDPDDMPDRPRLFFKTPNAVSGHEDTVMLPTPGVSGDRLEELSSGSITRGEGRIDHEAEFAVVIREQCRNVAKSNAREVIDGYTCLNDVSNRDDQGVETNWVRGKSFDNSAPMGPVVASPDIVPENPRVQLRVNGETRQDSKGDKLLFTVPEVIADVSQFLTLEPGDVIAMGTPSGVDKLRDGDTVQVEVEGVGTLEHYVEGPA